MILIDIIWIISLNKRIVSVKTSNLQRSSQNTSSNANEMQMTMLMSKQLDANIVIRNVKKRNLFVPYDYDANEHQFDCGGVPNHLAIS